MTATWTTPKTWSSALVTSTDMNTHIRDNLDYLKARPVARVSDLDGTVSNTTSTSFTDITGASVSITTSGSSRLLILGNVSWAESAAASAFLTAVVDGTNQGDASNGIVYSTAMTTAGQVAAFAFLTTAAVSDAAHTVKLQYRTSANTLTVTAFSLTVLEVF